MCECLKRADGTWHVDECCASVMDDYHSGKQPPCPVCEKRHRANEGVTFWSCSCSEPRPICAECFGVLPSDKAPASGA
jgi:hypothetical protein